MYLNARSSCLTITSKEPEEIHFVAQKGPSMFKSESRVNCGSDPASVTFLSRVVVSFSRELFASLQQTVTPHPSDEGIDRLLRNFVLIPSLSYYSRHYCSCNLLQKIKSHVSHEGVVVKCTKKCFTRS